MAEHTRVDTVYWKDGKWGPAISDLAMYNRIVYSFSEYNYVTFEVKEGDKWKNLKLKDKLMTEEYGYLGHVYDIQPASDDDVRLESGCTPAIQDRDVRLRLGVHQVANRDECVIVTSPRVATEETEALITGLNAYADKKMSAKPSSFGKYGYKTRVQAFNYDFYLPVGNVEAFTNRVDMLGGVILDGKPDMDAMQAAHEQAIARMIILSQAREWLERIARDPIPDDEAKREVLTLLYGFKEELKRIAIPQDFDRIQKDIGKACVFREDVKAEDKAEAHLWLSAIEDYNTQAEIVQNDVVSTLNRIDRSTMYYNGHTTLAYQIAREMDIDVSVLSTMDSVILSVREQMERTRNTFSQLRAAQRGVEELMSQMRTKDERIVTLEQEATAFDTERQQMQQRIHELEQKTVGVRKLNLN